MAMMQTEFITPCGILRLTDADGTAILFRIAQDILPYQASVYDIIADARVPVRTEHQYTVTIPTETLAVGAEYMLRLYGAHTYAYGDSDERAIANAVTVGDCTLSLGAQDLNDEEKIRQVVPVLRDGVQIGLQPPAQYDESKFRSYVLFPLPDWSGFRFRLLDRSQTEIPFRLAWIRHTVEFAEPEEYVSAVTLWTIV